MCFSIKIVVYSCALSVFLAAGVAFADQGTSDLKPLTEQCAKGNKTLSNVNTKDECDKQGGVWAKIIGSKMPDDPFGKNTTMRPPDPLEKNKMKMPVDPLEKNKSMPPARQMVPPGGH